MGKFWDIFKSLHTIRTIIRYATIKINASNTISIECSSTVWSSTETGDLVVLNGELVVIGDLLSHRYVSLWVDHYLLQCTEVDHLGIAVGLQWNKSGVLLALCTGHPVYIKIRAKMSAPYFQLWEPSLAWLATQDYYYYNNIASGAWGWGYSVWNHQNNSMLLQWIMLH